MTNLKQAVFSLVTTLMTRRTCYTSYSNNLAICRFLHLTTVNLDSLLWLRNETTCNGIDNNQMVPARLNTLNTIVTACLRSQSWSHFQRLNANMLLSTATFRNKWHLCLIRKTLLPITGSFGNTNSDKPNKWNENQSIILVRFWLGMYSCHNLTTRVSASLSRSKTPAK